MANIKVRKRNQNILKSFNVLGTTSSLFIGSIIQLDLNSKQFVTYPLWKHIIVQIKDHAPFLLTISAFIIVCSFLLLKLTNSVAILKCIAVKLDTLRDWLCCNINGDYDDNHRVTLFKYKKSYYGLLLRRKYWANKYFPWTFERTPWSGWLVPISRSGHTGQNARAVFWAPDSGRKAEGVAGIAWAKGGDMVHFEKLPKISHTTNDENKRRYCERTRISPMLLESYIKENATPSRSFLAFLILVDGEAWGVIVVDSQSEEGIDITQMQKAMEVTCSLLPVLLEEL
ncbi:hypothetical protein [Aliivibrio fischeri]|uniref:hypothetical protein n=1 Tax=Aliivibrio fischeri TaxID=668 RepID=UPI001F29EB8D|nr:hypothetical protein [Aliivibrio fischeri]MCE7534594.1 hypothetical protein [Aliivibrio fischeri]MCE7554058.1 hypothetical protein [Aliivibrio fischeri]MCE7557570.1 hypothetical protein [Aliivibrio fischeri]MCE7561090.1 hypothetical protein [Aliivibrio fischeri]MCE7568498.1 hypothetical protein [Aliivibrio fischeri]